MLWGGLELAVKGPDLGEDSLGKQSRRKSIVQPFRIFYSLAWHHGLAGPGETYSRAPQRYAALRRLAAWTARMSIFFKTVRSAFYLQPMANLEVALKIS